MGHFIMSQSELHATEGENMDLLIYSIFHICRVRTLFGISDMDNYELCESYCHDQILDNHYYMCC